MFIIPLYFSILFGTAAMITPLARVSNEFTSWSMQWVIIIAQMLGLVAGTRSLFPEDATTFQICYLMGTVLVCDFTWLRIMSENARIRKSADKIEEYKESVGFVPLEPLNLKHMMGCFFFTILLWSGGHVVGNHAVVQWSKTTWLAGLEWGVFGLLALGGWLLMALAFSRQADCSKCFKPVHGVSIGKDVQCFGCDALYQGVPGGMVPKKKAAGSS